ncbi:MAG: hypothetical protein QM765_37650 [Myxococcales bacterium]
MGQNLVIRKLRIDTSTVPPQYALGPQPLSDTTPTPFDLSTINSGELYDTLKELMGAQNGLANGGRNAYADSANPDGRPYFLYFTSRRVEVRTCVDELDFQVSGALQALDPTCSIPGCSPPDWRCVSLSGPLMSVASQRTRFSYDPTLFLR